MGFFTFTLADRKAKKDELFEYKKKDKLPYDGYAEVICPDNSIIVEPSYNGYGEFGGYDIYQLVVDWNKPFLKDIIDEYEVRLEKESKMTEFHETMIKVGRAYIEDDLKKIEEILDEYGARWIKMDWKRALGIFLACDDNAKLPRPIKIVGRDCTKKDYNSLYPSDVTQ